MAKFKIKGLNELKKELTKMERSVPLEVERGIKSIADAILTDAVSRVPADKGLLRASAFVEKIEGGYTVGFSAKYAPYQEFGTGNLVEVPTGYETYAMEFYVDGSGKTRPQPFLFPAFLSRRDKITDDLEVKLRDFLSRI